MITLKQCALIACLFALPTSLFCSKRDLYEEIRKKNEQAASQRREYTAALNRAAAARVNAEGRLAVARYEQQKAARDKAALEKWQKNLAAAAAPKRK